MDYTRDEKCSPSLVEATLVIKSDDEKLGWYPS